MGNAKAADVETVVVGAGAVGLAIARALAAAGHAVLVLERRDGIGRETSSHSSEVIHAGLYYPPRSLKARLCVEGNRRMYDFAREAGVTAVRYGKLLVAADAAERDRLDGIRRNAAASGVTDLVALTGGEAAALEPELACVAALLSPSSGVIDSQAFLVALEGHLSALKGSVVLNHALTGISAEAGGLFALTVSHGGSASLLTARNLVLAAGLGATAVGRMLSYRAGYDVPETRLARGHYYALDRASPFRHLVYPIPGEGWLGVHLTLDVAGQARFGPDLEWQSGTAGEPSYVFDDGEGERRARFEAAIRRYWPALPPGSLRPGYVGVRPKIYREGDAVPDFAIHGPRHHGLDRLVALYGVESPGLTCSLAIGAFVAQMLPR